jgi:hypothetical protein
LIHVLNRIKNNCVQINNSTYNNFPWPDLAPSFKPNQAAAPVQLAKAAIETAAQAVPATLRHRYIKLFGGSKYDLLVIVRVEPDGSIFWNMMQRERKKMNDLRMGERLISGT